MSEASKTGDSSESAPLKSGPEKSGPEKSGPVKSGPVKPAVVQPPVDPFEEFKEMLAEQSERQGRLRHVQQFLNSPMFFDLRDQPTVVSDPPEVIEERKRDLDYRIRVLESLISLMIEERDSLDKVRSVVASEPEPAPEPVPQPRRAQA